MTDNINHPNHYQSESGIEVLDVITAFGSDSEITGYYKGNILKYVLRYDKKGGIEDLRKAEFYLKKLIELKENKKPPEIKFDYPKYIRNHEKDIKGAMREMIIKEGVF